MAGVNEFYGRAIHNTYFPFWESFMKRCNGTVRDW